MAKINVLSKEVSELIAAGEVIDRPCSVVKELLENAIDSKAANVTVEIKNGGRTYMRVTDNGEGIEKEDLPTAFLRHATSKIKSPGDLLKIHSLGFRGEALASICAVSKVNILSKRHENELGARIINEGGEVKIIEDCGCPNGTTVTVNDLFYNVPARLKFLKKDVTEGNAIAAMINKLALSHPEISFKFIRDNRQELITAGDGDLYSAIYSVLGRTFAKNLIKVSHSQDGISVEGYTIKPLEAKSKRSFQNFFINSRYVKSVTCMVSLEEAYRNQIMTGKFPACVLNISIDPSMVDVNVHPSKVEVKFSNEKLIYDAVYFAIKNALMKEETPTELKAQNTKYFASTELYGFKPTEGEQTSFSQRESTESDSKFEHIKVQPKEDFFGSRQSFYSKPADSQGGFRSSTPSYDFDEFPNEYHVKAAEPVSTEPDIPQDFKYINADSLKKHTPVAEPEPEPIVNKKPALKVLGEVFDTYIVVEHGEDMYLVDKHAAHERINFEKLKSGMTELSSQMLIEPVEVMLSYDEYDALLQNLEECKKLGFVIEDSGAPNVAVKGLPVIVNSDDAEDTVGELAKNFLEHKKSPQVDVLDELCHSMACKASIKGNIPSKLPELEVLCEQAFDENLTKYCPHGRPIYVKFSRREIEKLFKRIV